MYHNKLISQSRRLQQYNKWIHLLPINYNIDLLYKNTAFLNIAQIPERIYCILNNITLKPLCHNCNIKPVRFHHNPEWGYGKYCSVKCCNSHPNKIENTKQNLLNKYGVISTAQLEHVKNKSKQTCLKNYGVENPMFDPELTAKCMETRIKKFGKIILPNIGNNEKYLLDKQEQIDNCIIERDFKIGPYSPDGYCRETNTIYEVYEKYHYGWQRQIEHDKKRQIYIENKLKCKFVIIKDC